MSDVFSVASFTKNFSWNESYRRLHTSIRSGFSGKLEPVTRDRWRADSDIDDKDLELVPMNFFLYSMQGAKKDFLLIDRLVEIAVQNSYDAQFAKLALFAFHLANSGHWRRSLWPDGRVAGWANVFVREAAWKNGEWINSAFQDGFLEAFIESHVDGKSTHKVFTNYRFMLRSAGVLIDDKLQPPNFVDRWYIDATQLFWDRQIFDGVLPANGDAKAFEASFFKREIHKLLGCKEDQARAFITVAYREYSKKAAASRAEQLGKLRDAGLIAA